MADGAIFGGAGDFVTAPELSPLFAACLAAAVDPLLAAAGGGEILEFGAGSGRLAADLVEALARRGRAPRRYRIVEPSRSLQLRQRKFLEGVGAGATAFEWLDAPPREPWSGVAIANEVVDALPVDRFRVTAQGCEAIGVVADGDAFRWRARARRRAAGGGRRRPAGPVAGTHARQDSPRSCGPARPSGCAMRRHRSGAARSSSSTTGCRARTTTTPRATAAHSQHSGGIAASRTCWRRRARRT